MDCRKTLVWAVGAGIVLAALGHSAAAQPANKNFYQYRAARYAQRVNAGSPQTRAEELPPGSSSTPQSSKGLRADPFADDGMPVQGYGPAGNHDGLYFSDMNWHDGYAYGASCGPSAPAPSGSFFFTADYLYLRASFSEAAAFFEQDTSQNLLVERELHQLDFDYESSYRFGGGYRWCDCGDEIRFLYTRLASSAGEEVPFDQNVLIPFEPGTPPGGTTLIDADVDLRSYDLECRKVIPLGGGCSDCGDPCSGGCGDSCGRACPLWDLTWSGGVRAADGGWERSYTALDDAGVQVGEAVSEMDFQGVGAKVGLEARRYFFASGWLSAYVKGDLSLLWGELEFDIERTVEITPGVDSVTTQETENRQIIPVTEIEAGLTGQITCNSRISAGYMLSAWHDLGFRDEFQLPPPATDPFPVHYDDANILGFDGWYARVELSY